MLDPEGLGRTSKIGDRHAPRGLLPRAPFWCHPRASFVVLISLSVPVFAAAVSFGPKEPAWLQLFPQGTSPAPRAGYSLVLDTARNRLLMFGGYDGTYRNDLWALSLSGTPTWTQITPSGPPVGRSDHTAIYDPVRDRLWIFAGSDASGYRHDVYYLALASPTAWAPVTPAGTAPGNRRSHTAVYDPVADRMIVFGGYVYLNDTWTLSLSGTPTWTQLTPTGGPPSARQGHSACWDVAGNRMIVFGGDNGPNYLNDVWSLSFSGGAHWTSLSPSGVAPSGGRRFHASAYDQAGNLLVLRRARRPRKPALLRSVEPVARRVARWEPAPALGSLPRKTHGCRRRLRRSERSDGRLRWVRQRRHIPK